MLRIVDVKNKSESLIKELNKEISNLSKYNKNSSENEDNISKTLSKIQFQINEYEYLTNIKFKRNKKVKNPQKKIIQRKLKIKTDKKNKQSKSFLRWLINNSEL